MELVYSVVFQVLICFTNKFIKIVKCFYKFNFRDHVPDTHTQKLYPVTKLFCNFSLVADAN